MKYEKEMILEIKPKYNLLYEFFRHIENLIVLLLMIVPAKILDILKIYIVFITGYIIFLMICLVINKIKSKNYYYRFYVEEVLYKNNWLNNEEKRVQYINLKTIYYNQTFIQRLFKFGDIILIQKGFNLLNKSIKLCYIENVEEVYEQLNNIILKQR